ncbi:MAG: MATE family efflux transporter [Clostridia bacterium]|nr:MATE family efflux transporter [Clostridia bacterium]
MTPRRKEILRISIPAVLESLLTTMTSMIDSKMVSSLGIAAISAVSVTNQPRLFILCIFFAINTTVSSLTARYFGKGDRDGANRILATALVGVFILGLIIGGLCIVFAEPIMKICSNQPDTMADSVAYFRIVAGGILFNVIFMVINASLRGCGYTKLTLVSNIASCAVNIVLNYMLIEGHWGAPALGIKGAALATVGGTIVAMFICFVFIIKKSFYISIFYYIKQKLKLTMRCVLEMWEMLRKIVLENLLTRVGFLISGMIAARTGSLSMSVYSIGMHLLNVNFALGSGMQTAAVALVGKSFGAGNTEEIKSYSKQILKFGAIASIVLSAAFIVLGKPYYSFFGDNDTFITMGAISCIIIGLISPIQTAQIIYSGIFQGVGDVRYTMIASIISVTLVNTLVNFVAVYVFNAGVWGIWCGMFVSQIVKMLMLHIRYKKKIVGGLVSE